MDKKTLQRKEVRSGVVMLHSKKRCQEPFIQAPGASVEPNKRVQAPLAAAATQERRLPAAPARLALLR
jgi:hypothetical protein